MWRYVALGDSITAGKGVKSLRLAFPARLVALEERRGGASSQVLAQPGWTSKDLLRAVTGGGCPGIARADLVTIWIGGNDLLRAGLAIVKGAPPAVVEKALTSYGQNMALLAGQVRKVCGGNVVLVLQYNPFPCSPIACQAVGRLNEVTTRIARELGLPLAAADVWFAGREALLIAGYQGGRVEDVRRARELPVHPNEAGHRLIAEKLARMVGWR
jgi:acyl-CoA thioesterase-1